MGSEYVASQARDLIKNGGPNVAYVLELVHQIGKLRPDQLSRLSEAFNQADQNPAAQLDAGDAGWRSACAAGGQRQRAWYLARQAAAAVATEQGATYGIAYRIGYVTAAVAHRDMLTAQQFDTLTEPWRAAIGPIPGPS